MKSKRLVTFLSLFAVIVANIIYAGLECWWAPGLMSFYINPTLVISFDVIFAYALFFVNYDNVKEALLFRPYLVKLAKKVFVFLLVVLLIINVWFDSADIFWWRNTLMILLSLAGVLIVWGSNHSSNKDRVSTESLGRVAKLIGAVIILGLIWFYVRGITDLSFSLDETLERFSHLGIEKNWLPIFPSGNSSLRGAGYYFITFAFSKIFRLPSVEYLRYFNLFILPFLAWPIYKISLRLRDRYFAALTTLLVLLSPVLIGLAREARFYFWNLTAYLLLFYILYRWYQARRVSLTSLLFFVFIVQISFQAKQTFLFIPSALIFAAINYRETWYLIRKYPVLPVVIGWAFWLASTFHKVGGQFYTSTSGYGPVQSTTSFFQVAQGLRDFNLTSFDFFLNSHPFIIVTIPLTLAFMVVGHTHKRLLGGLLIFAAVPLSGLMLLAQSHLLRYTAFFMPFVLILTWYVLYEVLGILSLNNQSTTFGLNSATNSLRKVPFRSIILSIVLIFGFYIPLNQNDAVSSKQTVSYAELYKRYLTEDYTYTQSLILGGYKNNFRGAVNYLREHLRPDDVVVYTDNNDTFLYLTEYGINNSSYWLGGSAVNIAFFADEFGNNYNTYTSDLALVDNSDLMDIEAASREGDVYIVTELNIFASNLSKDLKSYITTNYSLDYEDVYGQLGSRIFNNDEPVGMRVYKKI